MSSIVERLNNRYNAARAIREKAQQDVVRITDANYLLLEFSVRLAYTPPFIWEGIFERGVNREEFWDQALRGVVLNGKLGGTLSFVDWLVKACQPNNQAQATQVYEPDSHISPMQSFAQIALGHLGDRAYNAWKEIHTETAGSIISYLGTDELPIVRYPRELIRGRFRSENLYGGGARYFLPASLEAVEVQLTYPMRSRYPTSKIVVNPIR